MRVPSTVLVNAPPGADVAPRDPEGRQLAAACVAGDTEARRRLQELLWPLIGELLRTRGHNPTTEPGELFAYAVEKDRVYRRLRTYAGRVSLKSYLLKYVLRHLFLQLIGERERKSVKTVSLDDLGPTEETLAPTAAPATVLAENDTILQAVQQLAPERRLLLKLLHIEDFDLDGDERALLARRGNRSSAEVDHTIERARAAVRAREAGRRERFDKVALVARSIQLYEQRLERLGCRAAERGQTADLEQERAEIEAKLAWRRRQHQTLLDESRRAQVTLPYREIAALMSMPIGTVTSELTRIRRELRRLLARACSEKEDA